jgi:alkanesulfonate monooxygenase SsuD/methylene tetrahydromethanopterin reductase-like flavin-dependent oxidoreductase (luciferase family)
VVDELIAWADETDVDGFNLFRLVVPGSLDAFVDLVVPSCSHAVSTRPIRSLHARAKRRLRWNEP